MTGAVRKANPSDKSKPQLWKSVVCPFSQRVQFAFHVMGVQVEEIEVNLMNKPATLFEVNPGGQVPAIKDRGNCLYDSIICLQYIDEEWKSHSGVCLLPTDAADRARLRIFFNSFNATLVPGVDILKNGSSRQDLDKAKEVMLKGYENFNNLLERHGDGPFHGGKNPDAADASMVPYGTRVAVFNHYFPFEIPKEWTRYHQWWDAMTKHASYIATAPDVKFLTEAAGRNLGKWKDV